VKSKNESIPEQGFPMIALKLFIPISGPPPSSIVKEMTYGLYVTSVKNRRNILCNIVEISAENSVHRFCIINNIAKNTKNNIMAKIIFCLNSLKNCLSRSRPYIDMPNRTINKMLIIILIKPHNIGD